MCAAFLCHRHAARNHVARTRSTPDLRMCHVQAAAEGQRRQGRGKRIEASERGHGMGFTSGYFERQQWVLLRNLFDLVGGDEGGFSTSPRLAVLKGMWPHMTEAINHGICRCPRPPGKPLFSWMVSAEHSPPGNRAPPQYDRNRSGPSVCSGSRGPRGGARRSRSSTSCNEATAAVRLMRPRPMSRTR